MNLGDVVDGAGEVLVPAAAIVCRAVLEGDPVPAPRPRVTGRGAYFPERYTTYRDNLSWALKFGLERRSAPVADPVVVLALFYRATRRRVDLDNLAKTVLDAGNGVVWADDDLVQQLNVAKHHRPERPRVEVLVWQAGAV